MAGPDMIAGLLLSSTIGMAFDLQELLMVSGKGRGGISF